MLTINGQNWELPQGNYTEPTIGYEDEFIEKVMISGKIRRIYKGRRFYAKFYYGFLSERQILEMRELLSTQRSDGYLTVTADTAYGIFSGQAIVDLNNNQRSFEYDAITGEKNWLDWTLTIKAVDYDN